MSDSEPQAQPDVFDVTKIRAFSGIPLGHFAVIQTRVSFGKRLTAFMNKERVYAYLLINQVEKQFSLGLDETLKFLADCKILLTAKGKDIVEDLIADIHRGKEKGLDTPTVISEGVDPVNGVDAEITWAVELPGTEDDPTRIKHDQDAAKIDHREVRRAVAVETGDLILTITPPTLGESGRDIFGKTIPAIDGRERGFEPGEGVRTDEKGLQFFATETGHVSIEDHKITVSPVMKVPAVDFNVGNIDYKGRVEVVKDVNEGFKVVAEKEIAIGGDVKDAYLKAGRSLSAQAFLGKDCSVEAEGEIRVARIVNAQVHGMSGLSVTQEIVNADLQIAGRVNASEASLVGSELTCLGPVYIGTLGSPADTAATQRIVIDPDSLKVGELLELREKVAKFAAQLEKIKGGLGPIAEKRQLAKTLPDSRKGAVTKLLDNLDILDMHLNMAQKELKDKVKPWQDRVVPEIYVKKIYPGTKVNLLGVGKIFNEPIPSPVSIKLDRATKAIKVEPWLKDGEADLA